MRLKLFFFNRLEAGKRAYNLTGVNQLGVKRLQFGGTRKDVEKKNFTTARTDQHFNHTMPTIRGPNILKKTNTGNKTGNSTVATLCNDSTNVTTVEKAPKVINRKHSIHSKCVCFPQQIVAATIISHVNNQGIAAFTVIRLFVLEIAKSTAFTGSESCYIAIDRGW